MSSPGRPCPACATPVPEEALYCPACGAATPTEISLETGTEHRPEAGGLDEAEQRARVQRVLGEHFELGRLLGRGGFAEVYAATDRKLQRTVAVKVLRPDLVVNRSLTERFLREARAAAKLRHPNIIPIYQVGEAEGLAYFLMPLIEGESLREYLERVGPLPIEEARRLLRETAEALAVAHKAGLVHRDIKPDNIMLEGEERRAIVTDFGIAKALGSGEAGLTGTGMIIGTPQYMSPEQATGEKEIDSRSDIYSLGVVGYQMLTGELPFQGASGPAVLVKHVTEAPRPLQAKRSDVPAEIAAVVMRAMAKGPEERWPSAAAMASALLSTGKAAAPSAVARGLASQARNRRPARAYVIGAAAILLLVIVFGPRVVRAARYYTRLRPLLSRAADAGIELGRAALNESPALFPDSGYVTLQADQPIRDPDSSIVPGVTRSIYIGPTHSGTAPGVMATILAVIRDGRGPIVVRRGELRPESFAEYVDFRGGSQSGICYGGGDDIYGTTYANGDICIYTSGAHFHGTLLATGTIAGLNHATFDAGYVQHATPIQLPTDSALGRLGAYGEMGGTAFTAPDGGAPTQARLRIEFTALDLDGDGKVTGPDEGFFRVFQDSGASHADYVTGDAAGTAGAPRNCGDFHTTGRATVFYTAAYHLDASHPVPGGDVVHSTNRRIAAAQSLQVAHARCFLGGDEHLDVVAGRNTFVPVGPLGHWVRFSATPDSTVIAALKNPASGATDTTLAARKLAAQYLWPLSTRYNRHFRGVISIKGRVAVSGVVRGRVTLFASGNIIIVDDLSHANPPDSVPCPAGDALGLASSGSIYMADNVLNVPEPWGPSGEYRSYAAGSHRGLVQATLLTLGSFWVENYAGGAKAFRQCDGVPTGRGCLYLTGGRIQQALGAIGTTSGTGYVKRFRYDRCAAEPPPPHFPTTGRFFGNRREDVGADGFDPARYFRAQAPR